MPYAVSQEAEVSDKYLINAISILFITQVDITWQMCFSFSYQWAKIANLVSSVIDHVHGGAEQTSFNFPSQMSSAHQHLRELFQELFLHTSQYNLQVIK